MAYQFTLKDKSIEAGLRRIAVEEIDGALAALEKSAQPLPPRVHEARKAVKKLRGLIRLVRPGFPAYEAENAALRAAGRTLRQLRDAHAAAETLDRLAAAAEVQAAAPDRPPAPDSAQEREAIAAFRSALGDLRERVPGWRIRGDALDALEAGLEDTFAKAAKTMRKALKKPADDAIHDWRKRAKDHWYQARLLAPVWPELMLPHVAAADRLGEALGDYNDLSVLIRDLARGDTGDSARVTLVEEALARREALFDEASLLSRRLFAGSPEAFARRWRLWWEVWRG